MLELRGVFLLLHLLSTLAMAAPLYMLVVVNERARFKSPLNYLTDRYMENIIRKNSIRCFVFQGTMLISGWALMYITAKSWTDPVMVIKIIALFALIGMLHYIHFFVQPRIEAIINQTKPDEPVPQDLAPKLAKLRLKRKRFSAGCLFLVLTAMIMGLRTTFYFNIYLAIAFVVLSGIYAWRVYRTGVPFGWA